MPQDKKSEEQPTVLPWHTQVAKSFARYVGTDDPLYAEQIAGQLAESMARHDPHATTLRLLEEMIEEEVEGPFFHEDEHSPESVLNRARAHLAAQGGGK